MSTEYKTACCGHYFVGLNHSPMTTNSNLSVTCRACNSNIPENMVPYFPVNERSLDSREMRIEIPEYMVTIPRQWRNVEAPTTTRTPIDNRTPQQARDEYSRRMNQHVGRVHRADRSQPAIQHLRRHQEATLEAIRNVVNPPVMVSSDFGGMEYRSTTTAGHVHRRNIEGQWEDLAQYMQRPVERTLHETDFTVFGARIFVASNDRDRSIRQGARFDQDTIREYLVSERAAGTHRIVVSNSQYEWLMQTMNEHIVQRRPDRPDNGEIYGRGVLDSTIEYVQQMARASSNMFDQTLIDSLMPMMRGALEETMGRDSKTKNKADKPDTTYVSPWLP